MNAVHRRAVLAQVADAFVDETFPGRRCVVADATRLTEPALRRLPHRLPEQRHRAGAHEFTCGDGLPPGPHPV
ncbi:hypothetical protein [Kitasatospora griseola]|uniref:hypothetical protein n=1 Tax=Kitasatospora griseola TaxID=2064 RepID=UPI003804574B